MKWLSKIYRVLFCALPVALFFSYYPVIVLGENESLNLELSLSLIVLVLFDVVGIVFLLARGKLKWLVGKWYFLLFPVFASLSILWSNNVMRGVLTFGVMWAVVMAVMVMIALRDELDKKFRRVASRVFIWASVAVCFWCLLQCILDLAGVPRDCTLLCAGCTSGVFGFPHPNGLTIEPQFMGNLLLAPILFTGYCLFDNKKYFGFFFLFLTTLFLIFSRGAIYAAIVGLVFMTAFLLVQKKATLKRAGLMWLVVVVSFVFALNLQGVMAEVGPTSDNYGTAVAKVLNQLSLGIIDVREKKIDGEMNLTEVSENETALQSGKTESTFDGYVVESTEVRKEMTRNALTVWRESPRNMLMGVGLGGAGEAMYEAGLTGSPKEIVQNQYASVLLEMGVIGVIFAVTLLLMLLFAVAKKAGNAIVLTLMVAYAVSLCFFAGLPNALQVYLMPVWVFVILRGDDKCDKLKIEKGLA